MKMKLSAISLRMFGVATIAAVLTSVAVIANATIISFDLTYSGAPFGNAATATGKISFDDSILPNAPGGHVNVSAATLGIVDFSITVSGASSGNGTFTLSDFQLVPGEENGWIWILSAPLNLAAELVGQVGFLDFNWCASTLSCGNPTAPGGVNPFTIATNGESGDELVLTSMRPSAAPEPGTLALLSLGLAGFRFARRKR
jgi:hypothetical protein